MKRRDFLKLGSLTASSALLGACAKPQPEETYVAYVEQPEDIVPGVSDWYATTCTLCSANCGLMARVIDARVVKLEGNPYHPVNQGKLCALGQSGLQVLYHPDRVRQPMKRKGERGQGEFEPISWDEAMSTLAKQLRANGASSAFMAMPLNGTQGLVIERFSRAVSGRGPVILDIEGHETVAAGLSMSLGSDRMPYYDLSNARYVLNFGADLFGSWVSPVNFGLQFGEFRQGRAGIRGKLVHVEPHMSITAAAADDWVPVPPGMEGLLALSIAQSLIAQGLAVKGQEFAGLEAYAPERMAERLGISAERIGALARDFGTRRPAIAVAGGAMAAQTNGVAAVAAVHTLNQLVGSVGAPGGLLASPVTPLRELNSLPAARFQEVRQLTTRMRQGAIKVLMVHEVDPIYLLPEAMGFRAALAQVPFLASFSSFIDDTTAYADLILPDHSFLESWGLRIPDPNVRTPAASSMQPVMAPLHDTRPMPDVLLSIGQALGPTAAGALPWPSYTALVKTSWETLSPDPNFWTRVRQLGVWTGKPSGGMGLRASGRIPAVPEPVFAGDASEFPFWFYPYVSLALRDGRAANLPWQQELPDPLTSGVWSSWIEINPQTAARLGLSDREPVALTSPRGTLKGRVSLNPGLHPDVIAMPMGQGHQAYGRYATGRGANPMTIVEPLEVEGTGALAWAATRVKIAKSSDAPSFTRIDRRTHPEEGHAPGFVSMRDLASQRWPWDGSSHDTPQRFQGGPGGGNSL
jgi:anaerobic selenocysteine-containing dehydrogenase